MKLLHFSCFHDRDNFIIFFQYLAVWEELKAVVDGMGMVKGLGSPGSATSPTQRTALPLPEEKSPFT